MNDIARRKPTAVGNTAASIRDALGQLSAGIAQSRATTRIVGGGNPLLRMAKDGCWIIGPQNEEADEAAIWLVNSRSMADGWVCWVKSDPNDKNSKNQLAGEVMAPMRPGATPPQPDPINGVPFTRQRQFDLKCLHGAQKGLQVTYKTPSVGGMRAVDRLIIAIQEEIDNFQAECEVTENAGGSADDVVPYVFPAIRLSSESYNHPAHGKTYNPILEIVGWGDQDGNLIETDDVGELPEQLTKPVAQPEPVKPARVRKNPTGAAPQAEPEPAPRSNGRARAGTARTAPQAAPVTPEPVSTTQAHIGQRRRPVAR